MKYKDTYPKIELNSKLVEILKTMTPRDIMICQSYYYGMKIAGLANMHKMSEDAILKVLTKFGE